MIGFFLWMKSSVNGIMRKGGLPMNITFEKAVLEYLDEKKCKEITVFFKQTGGG